MSKLAWVGVVLVATSCMTDFPELANGDAASTGGQSQGGSAGTAFGGNSGVGGAGGGNGGSGGNGGNVGGNSGDASVGGTGNTGGTGGTGGVADSGPDAPLVPGLLGHWPFDDASGNTAVDVVAGKNATLPDTGAGWTTSGVFGGAIALTGPKSGIDAPAWNDTQFPTTGTLTVWVKTVVIANDTSSRSILDGHDTDLDHLFIRRANGSPAIALQCAFQAKTAPYSFVKTVPITSNAWQLVAIGWSATQGFCYIHGNMQSGPVTPGWSPSQQRFSLGTNVTGTLDDVRLYDHMLSVSEMAKLLAEGP